MAERGEGSAARHPKRAGKQQGYSRFRGDCTVRRIGLLAGLWGLGALLLAMGTAAAPVFANDKAAALVIDANTGRVLHDQSGSAPRYPASLTKMMTLYLAFETVESGRISFSTRIPVSERAAGAAPSKLGLEAGSDIALRDAVKALIVKSANDMAIAVAEKIAGSEEAFARLMTKRARQIGMNDTTFRNASGLPDPEQVTTARDMLTLAMRLQDDFPQHYRLFTTRTFSYAGKTYRTHNALLGRFDGVDGIKTGYTRASGFNLVSSYRAKGKHVVAAVFGGVSAGVRDAHMRTLLARSIEKASTTRTRSSGPQLLAAAKPAKRPAVKPPPPKEVVATSADRPVEMPNRANLPAAPETARPDTPQIEAGAKPPAARIAIAKVKTVSVLPAADIAVASVPDPAPIATAGAPTTAAGPLVFTDTMPRPDFSALKAELAARASSDTTPAEADRRPDATAGAAEVAAERAFASLAGRGRPPSTLEAQLARFEATSGGASPQTARNSRDRPALATTDAESVPVPVPVPVASGVVRPAPAGSYHVQIGVYSTPDDAQRAMAAAKAKAAHILADSAPIAIPLAKGDRQLYRARFAGFDSASATTACNELRRSGLDCFVAKSN
jgi:D-alanyl-D-alanine carboxypeptidase